MALLSITSPHSHKGLRTSQLMLYVVLATVPGMLTMIYFFGLGVLFNVAFAALACMTFEAIAIKLRKRPIGFYLKDYSALVTGVLLGLSLPPYCPWWLLLSGSFFAIILAKQLYGGMGFNPFNPAMVAYVILLISFPIEMTQWTAPASVIADTQLPSFSEAIAHIFSGSEIDAYTAATPLDLMKQNTSLLTQDLYASQAIFSSGALAGAGWEWINLAFLCGGIVLLLLRVFTWHAPLAMLFTLGAMALIFNDGGSSSSGGSPLFHWFSGATMLGAFFIVTDPVSSAVSTRGRLIYGASIGVLIYVIRAWGSYPDAVAFAVLLMNFAAPFIDYYTLPRAYGHIKATRATRKED